MNWIESLQHAIQTMEEHLTDEISPSEIAAECGFTSGYLQKGFQIVTGYTFAEYQRNRKLYLAALDLYKNDLKVIEAALKYGYDSPDAFSRAFRKFHGFTPSQIEDRFSEIQIFLPLQIQIHVRGGERMDYEIQNLPEVEVIGKMYHIAPGENSYQIIPEKWNEFMLQASTAMNGSDPDNEVSKAIWQSNIGEFGICWDTGQGLDYMIAGKYRGGDIPDGFEIRKIRPMTWAVFTCYGPIPEALQSVNTQIFTEWLPQNPDYRLSEDVSVEYYPIGNGKAADYRSQIWIPIRKK